MLLGLGFASGRGGVGRCEGEGCGWVVGVWWWWCCASLGWGGWILCLAVVIGARCVGSGAKIFFLQTVDWDESWGHGGGEEVERICNYQPG